MKFVTFSTSEYQAVRDNFGMSIDKESNGKRAMRALRDVSEFCGFRDIDQYLEELPKRRGSLFKRKKK